MNKYLCGISQAHESKVSLQPTMIGNHAAMLLKLVINLDYICSCQEQAEKTLMSPHNL